MFTDNDGTITYDEFIAVVLPPEIVNGGGGIMDFESDDPDFKGAVTKKEQLAALKKQIKREFLTKAKNMREMFRRMGGAGDGEVDEYEFKTALRNANIGIGHEHITGLLFREIDADHSGHVDFKEFAANLNKDEHADKGGNFFVGGGRNPNKRFIPQVMKTSIGLKRTWEILKTKIEQRCKSSSGGVFAMTSPHVLAKMFHEFDQDGGGSLSRDEFEKALREKLGALFVVCCLFCCTATVSGLGKPLICFFCSCFLLLLFVSLFLATGMMMISKKDLDLLTDEFDKDGDGEITYEEFIAKVMPPEITHGGGGIMDFPCDDPAGQGTQVEQLNKLRKDIKNKMERNSKNMREAFRKMGGAGDGKVDQYEFKTCLRNLGIACGQPQLVDKLFHEIDDDHSGHLTFAEFTAGVEHPKDATHDIKIERHIPENYLRAPTPEGGVSQFNQANNQPANPQDDPRSEDIRSNASSVASSIKQKVGKSQEVKQRLSRWNNYPGLRKVPMVFAAQPKKRTTMAQQRAADLRRSQGRHPINMSERVRAASMRPQSAYIASRPGSNGGRNMTGRSRKRPSSGRRLRTAKSPARAATIQAAAQRASVRWKDSLKKSNYFRSAPAPIYSRKYGVANARTRLGSQLQEQVNYVSGKGLASANQKKLDLHNLLGITR